MNANIKLRLTGIGIGFLLCACSSSESVQAGKAAAKDSNGSAAVPLAEWKPLPAAKDLKLPPEVLAARERILGPDATDPAFVKLWWFGVSSFIASAGGHLFLFDAWEIVGAHKDYVPIGREELAELMPEVILVGHGHFDHAADAGYVAGRSGAAVVGSEEICATAKADAATEGTTAISPA